MGVGSTIKQIERNSYACVLEVAESIPEPHRFGLRCVCRMSLWQAQRVHGKLIRLLFLLVVVKMNGIPQFALRVVKRQLVRVVADFVDDLVRGPAICSLMMFICTESKTEG